MGYFWNNSNKSSEDLVVTATPAVVLADATNIDPGMTVTHEDELRLRRIEFNASLSKSHSRPIKYAVMLYEKSGEFIRGIQKPMNGKMQNILPSKVDERLMNANRLFHTKKCLGDRAAKIPEEAKAFMPSNKG